MNKPDMKLLRDDTESGTVILTRAMNRRTSTPQRLAPVLSLLFFVILVICFGSKVTPVHRRIDLPDLYEASISELQAGLEKGHFTSVDLVKTYFARINEVNLQGPALRAVLEMNPSALQQAAALDIERRRFGPRSRLHGVPILLKDNIATLHEEGMNTTAGSFALLGSVVPRDAGVAARLRAAGAILLGKVNLSEWSGARGTLPSGWSGRGGQATSAYILQGNPGGSSAGSAVATSIGLCAASLGTDTHGSVIFPSHLNNVVGIRPTVGLTSRAGVIPISEHQDTIGPITRSVTDAAIVLSVIAGRDPLDNYTLAQPPTVPDYTKALDATALKGARIGVARQFVDLTNNTEKMTAFNASLDIIRGLGATVIDPAYFPHFTELMQDGNESIVVRTDLKFNVQGYISGLSKTPASVGNFSDLIAFDIEHADEELVPPFWTDQSTFTACQYAEANQTYFDAIIFNKDLGQARGIDGALNALELDALILLSEDSFKPAAIAGYPIVTVPLGFLSASTPLSPAIPTRATGPNQPFGIAFMGTAFSESKLISYAFAYEQATLNRLKQLAIPDAIPRTQLIDII